MYLSIYVSEVKYMAEDERCTSDSTHIQAALWAKGV